MLGVSSIHVFSKVHPIVCIYQHVCKDLSGKLVQYLFLHFLINQFVLIRATHYLFVLVHGISTKLFCKLLALAYAIKIKTNIYQLIASNDCDYLSLKMMRQEGRRFLHADAYKSRLFQCCPTVYPYQNQLYNIFG